MQDVKASHTKPPGARNNIQGINQASENHTKALTGPHKVLQRATFRGSEMKDPQSFVNC